jgi:hypothetical protein
MLSSWLRSPKASSKRTASYRPTLESLDSRICPASPHFLKADASLTAAGGVLVSFKEAGLGNDVTINYDLQAQASGQYQWFNHGGNKPQGQPFQFAPITVDATGTFTSGKNGNITASLTLDPPPPDQQVVDAGSGKNWVLKETVTYTNITLTDTTNNVVVSASPSSIGPVTFVVPT